MGGKINGWELTYVGNDRVGIDLVWEVTGWKITEWVLI